MQHKHNLNQEDPEVISNLNPISYVDHLGEVIIKPFQLRYSYHFPAFSYIYYFF